jgi:alpha-1,3/alpha-1,6-mannosyltransferase
LYTPINEHFGIVPCEAMYARRPVVAIASGGPTESIREGVTGILCPMPPTPPLFAACMLKITRLSGNERKGWGDAGRALVTERFSLPAMTKQLDGLVQEMALIPPKYVISIPAAIIFIVSLYYLWSWIFG